MARFMFAFIWYFIYFLKRVLNNRSNKELVLIKKYLVSLLTFALVILAITSAQAPQALRSNSISVSNKHLVTYYIDLSGYSNDKVMPLSGAITCISICIPPGGPCTQEFCAITNSEGRALFKIDIVSNYTSLMSSTRLNQQPPLMLLRTHIETASGFWEDMNILVPIKLLLDGFYLKVNVGIVSPGNYGDLADDIVYLNNVKLTYNDAVGAFVPPPNITPTAIPTITVSTVITGTSTTSIINYLTVTKLLTTTSYLTFTLTKTTILTTTHTVTTTITKTTTRTATSFGVVYKTLTITKPISSVTTVTITKMITFSTTTTITSIKSIIRSVTIPVTTLVSTLVKTLTITKTLNRYGTLSSGPHTLTIVIALVLVAASVIALLLSRPRR